MDQIHKNKHCLINTKNEEYEINKDSKIDKIDKIDKNKKNVKAEEFDLIKKKCSLLNKKEYNKFQNFILNLWNNGIKKECYDKKAELLNIIGLYYYYNEPEKEKKKAVEYFMRAIDKKSALAMYNFGYYHIDRNNLVESEKYFLMAYDNGFISVSYELGYLYSIMKKHEESCKFYLISIKDKNCYSMSNYASYCLEKGDIQKSIELFKMSVKYGNHFAMNNIAVHYLNIENYEESEKYFKMALENDSNNLDLIYNVIILYFKTKKNEELINFSSIYLEKETEKLENIFNYLKIIFNSCYVKLYNFFLKINNKSDKINNVLKDLEKHKQVIVYKNKLRVFKELKNYKKCSLCLEDDVLNIVMDCFHEICIECYSVNMKCYYKWCCCNN
jgi:TPR repeat protein